MISATPAFCINAMPPLERRREEIVGCVFHAMRAVVVARRVIAQRKTLQRALA
jgi:hypothetical protein